MTVVLYRLELSDLLVCFCVSFSLFFVVSRCVLGGLLVGLVTTVGYLVVYRLFAYPAADETNFKRYTDGLLVGAHRGLALDAPENTLSAFKLSKTMRADSIEFDLEFTSDGMPVILHDDTVDRTTDGVGEIGRMTWEQAQKLNAAAKFTDRTKFPEEKIPTLRETLQLGTELGFKMFIDVKLPTPEAVDAIVKLFREFPQLYETTSVCSFYPQVAYLIKRSDSRIITGHTWHHGFFSHTDSSRTVPKFNDWYVQIAAELFEKFYLWSLHNWLYKWTGINLVLAHHNAVSSEYIRYWKERGVQVVAWTVNDVHEKRYFLNTLKCPILTDQLSDIVEELPHKKAD